MAVERQLKKLGIELPPVSAPVGSYVNAVQVGRFLHLSGKLPSFADGRLAKGKVGQDVDVDEAYQHARQVGLNLIAVMKAELGDLDRVNRIVKVFGLVNATPDFTQHPQVINGCSDLFAQVFEDKGKHARAAIGVASLPSGVSVEIECIVEVVQD